MTRPATSPHPPSTRDVVVHTLIGQPAGLPAPASVDLATFWTRFEQAAPAHLRIAWAAAVTTLGQVLPRALHGRALVDLAPDTRDRLMRRAHRAPAVRELVEVAKVVASLAYFSADEVQRAVRSSAP